MAILYQPNKAASSRRTPKLRPPRGSPIPAEVICAPAIRTMAALLAVGTEPDPPNITRAFGFTDGGTTFVSSAAIMRMAGDMVENRSAARG